MPLPDRRQKRSDDPLIALHYQLAHARSTAALDAIVVADPAGVVVAGAGSWAACEELAAYAPMLAVAGREHGVPSRVDELRRDTAVSRVEVDGGLAELLVCVRGGHADDGRAATLADAMRGVARILRAAP